VIDPKVRAEALAAYEALNDSAMRRKLRDQAAVFSAAVYWQPGGFEHATLVREFRRIKATGFTCVRFHTQGPTEIGPGKFDFSRSDAWMKAAEEAEIDVVFHHEHPTSSDEMLAKHGLTRAQFEMLDGDDPKFVAPLRETLAPVIERYRKHPRLYMWVIYGEPSGGAKPITTEPQKAVFGRWVERKYGSIEAVDRAWNIYPEKGKPIIASFAEAWKAIAEMGPGGDLSAVPRTQLIFGAYTDLFRFQTAHTVARVRNVMKIVRELDPEHPTAVGAHQLFLNQPMLRWDHGEFARTADLYFSSIHMSWHFGTVAGEIDRPVYMQSRLTADMLKGGWASPFETTGGAVQYSGGHPNAMTPGLMQRLICSYLAAGNKAIAFWTWNSRPGGFEAGEYGLTTLSGEVSSWAKEAGKLSQLLVKYRRELWDASGEPRVGLVQSWDSEAVLLLENNRFDGEAKMQPAMAQVGAARTMINHHIPFEYVTEKELLAGIAGRYDTLYVPHARGISDATLETLRTYVKAGGRLIADVQFAFEDEHGKLRRTGKGSVQEQLFGAYVDMIHDTRTAAVSVNDLPLYGFYADLVPTTAQVIARFSTGAPAATEVRFGKGTAVLVGFDPGRMCHRPGNAGIEGWLAFVLDGQVQPTWKSDAPMIHRLRSPGADHYFVINDGAASRDVHIQAFDTRYRSGEELIRAAKIETDGLISVQVPGQSAAWVRLERA